MYWRLQTSSGFTEFFFPIKEQKEWFKELVRSDLSKNKSVQDCWKPLVMLRDEPKKDTNFFEIDNSGIIAISESALNASKHFFEDGVELLPIKTDVGIFYMINVLNVIDCLDKEMSDFSMNEFGKILKYRILEFYQEKLNNVHLFIIPEFPHANLVSHELLFFYEEFAFHGLEFDEDVNML